MFTTHHALPCRVEYYVLLKLLKFNLIQIRYRNFDRINQYGVSQLQYSLNISTFGRVVTSDLYSLRKYRNHQFNFIIYALILFNVNILLIKMYNCKYEVYIFNCNTI